VLRISCRCQLQNTQRPYSNVSTAGHLSAMKESHAQWGVILPVATLWVSFSEFTVQAARQKVFATFNTRRHAGERSYMRDGHSASAEPALPTRCDALRSIKRPPTIGAPWEGARCCRGARFANAPHPRGRFQTQCLRGDCPSPVGGALAGAPSKGALARTTLVKGRCANAHCLRVPLQRRPARGRRLASAPFNGALARAPDSLPSDATQGPQHVWRAAPGEADSPSCMYTQCPRIAGVAHWGTFQGAHTRCPAKRHP
jgi:hypothetical protein